MKQQRKYKKSHGVIDEIRPHQAAYNHFLDKQLRHAQNYGHLYSRGFTTGAQRNTQLDQTLRYDLIPPIVETLLARRLALGAEKYGDNNWKKGIPLTVHLNHFRDHLNNFLTGKADNDTGEPCWGNLAAMLCNLAFIAWEIQQDPKLYTQLVKSITKRPEDK